MSNKSFTILAIAIFLVSTLVSNWFFSSFAVGQGLVDPGADKSTQAKVGTNDYEALTFDENAPKTQECPLNGAKYSKEQEKWWKKHRPLGVMIENHLESRPQSGISLSDVTYEAVAEGGITRTLNVYYCQDGGIVGPVRSARTYFLDFISEYGQYPLYAHVGGANTPGPADALGQISEYGWSGYNDLNQFSIGFPTFKRDESRLGREVATEHTMYSTTGKLWAEAKKRGLTNVDKEGTQWDEDFVKYSFKEDAPSSARPESQNVKIEFWQDSSYFVDWIYDKASNTYLRKNGGVAHEDRNTHKQLSAKNVVVLYMNESSANDGYENNLHLLYGTKGTGKALIFMDGKQTKGTWKKSGRTGSTLLYDASGNEIKFNRGKIWFEIQRLEGDVTVS